MSGVVYDAGALVAAERSDRRLRADLRVRFEAGVVPVVPAQIVTGDPSDISRLANAAGVRLVIIET